MPRQKESFRKGYEVISNDLKQIQVSFRSNTYLVTRVITWVLYLNSFVNVINLMQITSNNPNVILIK